MTTEQVTTEQVITETVSINVTPERGNVVAKTKREILNDNLKDELFISDIRQKKYLIDNGFRYTCVKIIEGETIYKFRKDIKILKALKRYNSERIENNQEPSQAEVWITNMNEHKFLRNECNIRFEFVKRVPVGKDNNGEEVFITTYKYQQNSKLYKGMINYQKTKSY